MIMNSKTTEILNDVNEIGLELIALAVDSSLKDEDIKKINRCAEFLNKISKNTIELDSAISKAKNCLVCSAINDAYEICEETFKILDKI